MFGQKRPQYFNMSFLYGSMSLVNEVGTSSEKGSRYKWTLKTERIDMCF